MAEWSGPWDGVLPESPDAFGHPRWRELFSRLFIDGHLADGASAGLDVAASESDRTFTVGPGWAIIQGNVYVNDADLVFDVPAPASGQRVDFIAFRYDPAQAIVADKVKLVLIQGEDGSTTDPGIVQDEGGVWEVPRFRIGPYGAGPASGARIIGTMPITARRYYVPQGYNHPGEMPGLNARHGDEAYARDGRLWLNNVGTWEQATLRGVTIDGRHNALLVRRDQFADRVRGKWAPLFGRTLPTGDALRWTWGVTEYNAGLQNGDHSSEKIVPVTGIYDVEMNVSFTRSGSVPNGAFVSAQVRTGNQSSVSSRQFAMWGRTYLHGRGGLYVVAARGKLRLEEGTRVTFSLLNDSGGSIDIEPNASHTWYSITIDDTDGAAPPGVIVAF